MNTSATTKDALLEIGVRVASEKGLNSLNIRDIAKQGGISVGCIYNYFPSKATLVAATVEKIWADIFYQADKCALPNDFCACVQWIFDRIHNGSERYPSFFATHALSFSANEIAEGRAVMNRFLNHMKESLLQALDADTSIRKDVFSDSFTPHAFVSFVFDNLLMLSIKNTSSCAFLLELIRNAIY